MEALLDGLRVVQVAVAQAAEQVRVHVRDVHRHLLATPETARSDRRRRTTGQSSRQRKERRTLDVSATNALQDESSRAAGRSPAPWEARGEDDGVEADDEAEEDTSLIFGAGKWAIRRWFWRQDATKCAFIRALA